MKVKIFKLMALLVLCGSLYAQDYTRVYTYNGPGNGLDQGRAICLDSIGNIYVTGNSYGGSTTDMDFCTLKYLNADVPTAIWVARFNGTGSYSDQANAIAADKFGNVYVTGWAHMEPGGLDCGTVDMVTIKYNTNGAQQWMRKYDGPGSGSDYAYAITVDKFNNIIVTGSSWDNTYGDAITTIKYDQNGVQQWVARFTASSGTHDCGRAIITDIAGNVFVTGNSYQSGHGQDFMTIKYNPSGVQQWANRYNGTGNGDDTAYAIGIDQPGNIFVTGCAKNTGTNLDYTTIKYKNNGVVLWTAVFNGPGNGIDEARALVVDNSGCALVTGFSMGVHSGYDYETIKYGTDGVVIWEKRYNGPANLDDKALAMAISLVIPATDVPYYLYITGESQGTGTGYDYLTVKYTWAGDTIWTRRYNSSNNTDDVPAGIVAQPNSAVACMTGTGNSDMTTVKYFSRYRPDGGQETEDNVKILQNYPNPFNPTTTIEFNVQKDADVSIKVYDVVGKEVATLVNGKLEKGDYEINWNASAFPSGVYFYTLSTNGVKISTQRMLLVK